MTKKTRRPSPRAPLCRTAGFTLLELLVVFALMSAMVLITLPTLSTMYNRGKLTGAAQQIGTVLSLARLESIRRGVVTVVQVNYADDSLLAYADVNNAAGTPGSDLIYDPPVAAQTEVTVVRNYDYVITTYHLPGTVHWWGAPDNLPWMVNAVLGFTPNPKGGPNIAVFNPDGSVQATGQFRIGQGAFPRSVSAATDTQDNFLAVNVQPQATARIFLTKYNPTVTIGDATKYVPRGIDPTTGKAFWQWY